MSVEYDPVTGAERRKSVWSWLLLPLTAFLLGLAAMGWLLSRWQTAAVFLGVAPEPEPSCLLYTSPSPRDRTRSRMPSSA